MNRRAFLATLATAAAGEVGRRFFDMGGAWTRHDLLWGWDMAHGPSRTAWVVTGVSLGLSDYEKMFPDPTPMFKVGDVFTFEGHYAVNPPGRRMRV